MTASALALVALPASTTPPTAASNAPAITGALNFQFRRTARSRSEDRHGNGSGRKTKESDVTEIDQKKQQTG
jgi:hypothetical protein